MPLDLNSQEAVDYSTKTPMLPFEYTGDYKWAVKGFGYFPDAYNGECDIALVECLESDNDKVRVGSRWTLYFSQHATGKAKPFAAARIRSFVMACLAVTDDAKRGFDAKAGRNDLIEADEKGTIEDENIEIRHVRSNRPGRGDYEGQTFTEDSFEAA